MQQKVTQLTKSQAIEMYESETYKDMTSLEKVQFQLFQDRLCMPFDEFHKAMEDVFERPVFLHEFAEKDALQKEFFAKIQ